MALMKHVGKYGEKPCLVVFRELPDDEQYCLIVQTNTLDGRMHDDLMNVVQSIEAQQANDISEVLHRRQFTDGSNMLAGLHYSKKLERVPVKLVSLTPIPGQAVPLESVNAELRKLNGGYTPPKTDSAHLAEPQRRITTKDIPESSDLAGLVADGSVLESDGAEKVKTDGTSPTEVAKNLMFQAQLLEEDAQAILRDAGIKRQQAIQLDPSIAPKKEPRARANSAK